MWLGLAALLAIAIAVGIENRAEGTTPTMEELDISRAWVATHFESSDAAPPFSFRYGGQPVTEALQAWRTDSVVRKLSDSRTERTLTYADPKSGLEVRCVVIEYSDYPAVEWTVFFENKGSDTTPVLSDVQAANFSLSSAAPGDFVVYHADGSHAAPTDFHPRDTKLTRGKELRFAPYGGRSSDGVLPFFNLKQPDGNGMIAAIGWTGQWAASFTQKSDVDVKFQAGMETTHLKLYPGEKIRTPAILLCFWNDNRKHSQNLLRSLLLNHYSPTSDGVLADVPVGASPHSEIPFESTTETNMIEGITKVTSHNLPIDTWWIDAGWYLCPDAATGGRNWAKGVGNWEADPERYPNGMKPVADAAHQNGLKFLLWFEPERVMPGTWLYENHLDWLLAPPTGLPPELLYEERDGFHLLDLGNPKALAWAKETFSGMIRDVGIDIYRHDCNIYPLHYWRNGEAPDRQGMNEIRYILGLYDFFDSLQRGNRNLLIDNCASGGRRLDFEMLRRSAALWRSDDCWNADAEQSMTYGLSLWMPLHGVGSISVNPYDFRSGMGANFSASLRFYSDPAVWEPAIDLFTEYRSIRHLYHGDFYPLTPYSVSPQAWIAWQFHRSDLGEGMVQAFRRSDSDVFDTVFTLHGLSPEVQYLVANLDTSGTSRITGQELMDKGISVSINKARGSAVIVYKPIDE